MENNLLSIPDLIEKNIDFNSFSENQINQIIENTNFQKINKNQETPLMQLLTYQQQIPIALLEKSIKKSNLKTKNRRSQCPLALALIYQQNLPEKILEELILKSELKNIDYSRSTILHYASTYKGEIPIPLWEKIATNSINNYPELENVWTIIFLLKSKTSFSESFWKTIAKIPFYKMRTKEGNTPLMTAIEHNGSYPKHIWDKLLEECKCDQSNYITLETALIIALKTHTTQNSPITEDLWTKLIEKTKMNKTDRQAKTPLDHAVENHLTTPLSQNHWDLLFSKTTELSDLQFSEFLKTIKSSIENTGFDKFSQKQIISLFKSHLSSDFKRKDPETIDFIKNYIKTTKTYHLINSTIKKEYSTTPHNKHNNINKI
jgi:hypothetical protein